MKKICTIFFSLAFSVAGFMADARTVFMKDGGTGDGSTPEAPVATFDDAFAALGADGGTIVLCGTATQTANYPSGDLAKYTGEVVITSVCDGVDYRETAGAHWLMSAGRRFQLGGPTRFKDLNVKITASKNNFLLVICNYNEFTMDEGVNAEGFTFSAVANSLTVLGGCQDNLNNANGKDPEINILGGEALIVAFNRGTAKNFTEPKSSGTASINISGGVIHNVFASSVSSGLEGGNVDFNISGGKFVDHVHAGTYGANVAGGNELKLTVTGGDFTECAGLSITKKYPDQQVSTLDISRAGESELPVLLKTSAPQNVDNLVSNYGLPIKEFVEGETFTASNGITIPYRIRIPETVAADTKLPFLLFMHGNGSRGDDNMTQITSTGSACLYTFLGHDEPCIMVAPQCPKETMWVERDRYVGCPDYDITAPQNPYLFAANELMDHIVATRPVDRDRLYICGSSNGAGATWDMIVRYPEKFAAAVPVAGLRDAANAADFGAIVAKTPVWTFHGDADATLPVEGTRGMVAAAQAAGATDLKYTEVPGADHNTIWSIAAMTPGLAEWMFSKSRNSGSTGIADVADGGRVDVNGGEGEITVKARGCASVKVYAVGGVLVGEASCSDSGASIPVTQPGLYIVDVDAGGARYVSKVSVR